jgi:rhodanese-related sulfurtransferase
VVAVSGGQLLMHFENLVAVRNASVVLVDEPHRLRSAITAFWLLQLGEAHEYILDARPGHDLANFEALHEPPTQLLASSAQPQSVSAAQLSHHIAHAGARVVDVGPSIDFLRGHVPGASYATASEHGALGAALADAVANGQRLVLTSPDGRQALLAARDLLEAARNVWQRHGGERAAMAARGTDAGAAGQTLETGWKMTGCSRPSWMTGFHHARARVPTHSRLGAIPPLGAQISRRA